MEDQVIDSLSEGLGEPLSSDIKHPRLMQYKERRPVNDQEARRLKLLQEQKTRRNQSFEASRQWTELFKEAEAEDEDEGEECDVEENFQEESVNAKSRGTQPKISKLKDLLMFSEWMQQLPLELEEYWYCLMCPVGKRCIVSTSKGSTTAYNSHGKVLRTFQSMLPNGSRRQCDGDSSMLKTGKTILDCIWDPQSKTFYVLDILCWNGTYYMDTTLSFRRFWIKSKISEDHPQLLDRSASNPHPFIPLEFNSCDVPTISKLMCKYPCYPSNKPKLDGILFYHSEASYTPGSTPLVLWLLPFMIPELMGSEVMISEEYVQRRPGNYSGMHDFIEQYEKKREQRKKQFRRRHRDKVSYDVEMEEEDQEAELVPEESLDEMKLS